jgi:ABC-type Mn2+/Zn2+ transport system ATPase subunit
VAEADGDHAILAEGLTKSFGQVRALRGIDLVVPRGSVLGVLGPNGAGKTTAVRVLTTLLRPDGGRALVDGRDVVHQASAVRRSIGLAGMIWLFPVTFLSSAFVPISTMPGWLQAFANNQPVTHVIDTMRALALGGPVASNLWKSLVWLAGILIVFAPLAVRAYKRAS